MSSPETTSDEDAPRPQVPSPPPIHEPSHSRQPPANGAASSSSAEPRPAPAPDTKTRHSSSSSGDTEPTPAPALRRSKRLRRSSSAGREPADDAGGGPQVPPPLVRRRLFGPVEPGSVERARREHEQDVVRAQTQRWNYDFVEDRPLTGRWQWERERPSRSATRSRRPDSPGAGPAADQP